MNDLVYWDDSTKSWFVPKGTTGLTWMSTYTLNSIIRGEIIQMGIASVSDLRKECHLIKTTADFNFSMGRISSYTTNRHLWFKKLDDLGNEWFLVIERT